jgi:DNA-binding Lrp family transcriptional regulator
MVEIDEIDVKILRELIKDARTKLKDIAKSCGLSSTAIMNRVKRLRATGVITGAAMIFNMNAVGHMYPASVEISLNLHQEAQVIKLLREQVNVIDVSQTVGKSDLNVFLVAKSVQEIVILKQVLRNQKGVRRISVSLWSTPYFNVESIDLKPTRA